MDEELLSEFLVESNENMVEIEAQLMELEAHPDDASLLDGIFRTIHTVKGSCGFIGLKKLEGVAHAGENVLGKMRSTHYAATPEIVSMLLECADAIQVILDALGSSNCEPEVDNEALIRRLHAAERVIEGGVDVVAAAPAAGQDTAQEKPVEEVEKPENPDIEEESLAWLDDFSDIRELLQTADLAIAEKVLAAGFNGIKSIEGIAPPQALKLLGAAKAVVAQQASDNQTLPASASEPATDASETSLKDEPVLKPELQNVPVPASQAKDDSSTAKKDTSEGKTTTRAPETIRVDVSVLDSLMNQVGELVLTRNRLIQMVSGLGSATLQDGNGSSNSDAVKSLIPVSRDLNHITEGLQDQLLKTRMQPISTVWGTVPRIVRDMGRQLNKKIRVVMEGQETELDRTILAALKDPLTHIIRNSCDHGIEMPSERLASGKEDSGTLTLKASQEAGSIVILICDDGAGIDASRVKAKAVEMGVLNDETAATISDAAALQLIFHAGLSTAKKVSNISGRGVGMDVVRNSIEKAGGSVEISSEPDKGTTLRIRIPLTMAIISGMLVKCAGQLFAIPQMSVQELLGANASSSHWCEVAGHPFFRLRGQLLPVIGLRECLGMEASSDKEAHGSIVVVHAGNRRIGLFVDEILGAEELVVKPLGEHFRDTAVFGGCSILGDGSVVPILESNGLFHNMEMPADVDNTADGSVDESGKTGQIDDSQYILVFKSAGQRYAIPMMLVERLENIRANRIETASKHEVLQYRDQVIPVLRWNRILGEDVQAVEEACCLIIADNGKRMCLQVDSVDDIIETTLNMEMKSSETLFLGTSVIQDKVTEVIDVFELLKLADASWFEASTNGTEGRRSILFAEDAPFFRTMLIPVLESMDYEVWHAPDGEAACEILKQQIPDVILTDLEMPKLDGYGLAAWVRNQEELADVPVIAISSSPPAPDDEARRKNFHTVLNKMDRQGLQSCLEILHPRHDKDVGGKSVEDAAYRRPALVGGGV